MLPYWILFSVGAYFALSRLQPLAPQKRDGRWPVQWRLMFILLVLMIGLRHEVGGDWTTYLFHIELVTGVSFEEALYQGDPAYSLLNWIAVWWGGIYFVNTICAILFSWGLVTFCREQPYPWLALLVSIPYLVIVVAMGYTRQGVAIGLAMMGLVALGRGQTLRFVLWVAVAALFHKSAVILATLAVLAGTKRRLWKLVWVGAAAGVLYFLLLRESVDSLQYGYLESAYQSSGAAIRIFMNALPALLFLIFRTRFALPTGQQGFWTWMAVGALAFVGLLYASPSSTAVDRVALYLIPLQLFVWSRLPVAMGRVGNRKLWVGLVVAYSAVVQFTWLVFAKTAFAWLPYKFWPWEWLTG